MSISRSCTCNVLRNGPREGHIIPSCSILRANTWARVAILKAREKLLDKFKLTFFFILKFVGHYFLLLQENMLCGLGLVYSDYFPYSRKPSVDDVGNPSSVNAR